MTHLSQTVADRVQRVLGMSGLRKSTVFFALTSATTGRETSSHFIK